MKAHLFLRDNQLFITTEVIPEKPIVHTEGLNKSDVSNRLCVGYPIDKTPVVSCNDNPKVKCTCQLKMRKFHIAIASIKKRSTLVGNPGSNEVKTLLWIATNDVPMKEDNLYSIDCEIRHESVNPCIAKGDCQQPKDGWKCDTQCKMTYRVVFISHISSVSEKEEAQDFDSELKRLAGIDTKAYIDSDFDYEYRLNRFVDAIIPILKSRFTITRKS